MTTVPAPSEMDDSTFIKHFNLRHSKDGHIEERTSYPDELGTFRAFHRRLHDGTAASKSDIKHDHQQGSPAEVWQDGTEA
jgi:hypothetical protein